MKRILARAALLAILIGVVSCGRGVPIIVGSKSETEQMVLGEIVAQHLEHRLSAKIQRRLGMGGTPILYQALIAGDVGVYPEYTGLIESEILRETASRDPQVVFDRTQREMHRVAQVETMDPLGFDNPPVVVVHAADAVSLPNLSEAAAGSMEWRLGVSFDFQSRTDGLPALNQYRLKMAVPPRSMEKAQLFPAMEKGDVNMIAARATDGQLNSPGWRILKDDKGVFLPYEACLLVRQDKLAEIPQLRPALAELSGRFNAEIMRKLNAEVDVDHKALKDVASDFLVQAGLK